MSIENLEYLLVNMHPSRPTQSLEVSGWLQGQLTQAWSKIIGFLRSWKTQQKATVSDIPI